MDGERARVLCVDDEPFVLEGLSLHLGRRYAVSGATSGAAGLELLRAAPDTGVIVSDMRMPGMDGAEFLRRTRELAPQAARILLTGHADLDAAVAAVNDGQLFRFLTKPCPSAQLLAAVAAGIEQHRLVTAERVLLEQTLRGSIRALTDLLALASPVAFGRATRIRQAVVDAATELGIAERWQLEVAAMLSQAGMIALPPDTLERVYDGRPLSPAEQEMLDRTPALTDGLLAAIPRLEAVRAMLSDGAPGSAHEAGGRLVALGRQLLRAAVELETLEAQGCATRDAVELLRARPGRHDPAVLDALECVRDGTGGDGVLRELPLSALQVGMVLAEDVTLPNGVLLIARGYEVTAPLVERIRNFRNVVRHPVRAYVTGRSGR